MIFLRDLCLARGAKILFEHAQITIYKGQKTGITGRNGCGKTSLFAAMTGQMAPLEGSIDLPAGLSIGQVRQQTPDTDIPALDYVISGDARLAAAVRRRDEAYASGDGNRIALSEEECAAAGIFTIRPRAEMLLGGLGFDEHSMHAPVSELSGGWRMRLNLAQALIAPCDLLLLDEPTNHLDLNTIVFLADHLRQCRQTVLCVSHDRDFLDAFCTHILHFSGRSLTMWTGNYSAFEQRRAEQIRSEKAQRAAEEASLKHMQAFVERFRYKATKARQAQSMLKAIDRLKLTAVTQEDAPYRFGFAAPGRTVDVLVSCENLCAGYGSRSVLSGLNLTVRAGMRIALLGRNGEGKSTFIKTLTGRIAPLAGRLTLGHGVVTGYFAQHELEEINADLTPLQMLSAIDPKAREADLRTFLGSYAFSGDSALTPARTFSGGELARLALALIAFRRPNLLILDEPTNHLDISARENLALALTAYDGALILVSHDRHLLQSTADTLWLTENGSIREYDGTLEDYTRELSEQGDSLRRKASAVESAAVPAGTAAVAGSKSPGRREERRIRAQRQAALQPLKTRVRELEAEVAALNRRTEEADRQLADPALYSTPGADMPQLLKDRALLGRQLEEAEERWLQAMQEFETAQAGL